MKERDRYLPASNPAVKKRRRYAFLNGPDDSATIVFSRNGQSAEKTVKRYLSDDLKDPVKTDPKWKILNNNIGYVDMGRLEIKEIDAMWDMLKATSAIIFDIRNYPKGTVYAIGAKLFGREDFVTFTQPDPDYPGKFYWNKILSIGKNGNDKFKGKVILLVNEMTQSHGEFTVMGLQCAPNAITIGSQTAGADGNVSDAIFPDGTSTYITGLGVYYPDGTQTQRTGVKIDIEVQPTVSGIAEGRDEILEKAIKTASEKPIKN
nr:S41 family peptidase [Flavobacterium selenitireducens]